MRYETIFGEQYTSSADGCVKHYLMLNVFYNPDENPEADQIRHVEHAWDSCAGEYVSYRAIREDNPQWGQLSIDGALNTATVRGTVEVYDYLAGTWQSMEIAETYVGFGPRTRPRYTETVHLPGEWHQVNRYAFTSRQASPRPGGTLGLDQVTIEKGTTQTSTVLGGGARPAETGVSAGRNTSALHAE